MIDIESSSKNKEIYIHVGFHKTGSSSFQVFMTELYEHKLSLRKDFLYPKTGRTESLWPFNHYGLVPLALRDEKWMQECLQKEIEREGFNKIVFSCEDFSRMQNLFVIKCISDAFPDENVTIIAVIRDHDTWLESSYSEDVKRNRTFKDPWGYISRKMENFSFLETLTEIKNLVPRAELKIINYSSSDAVNRVVDIIFKEDSFRLEKEFRENTSLDPAIVFMLQDLYKTIPYDEEIALKYIHGAYKMQEKLGRSETTRGYLSTMERSIIFDKYYNETMTLSRHYLNIDRPYWSPVKNITKVSHDSKDEIRRIMLKYLEL